VASVQIESPHPPKRAHLSRKAHVSQSHTLAHSLDEARGALPLSMTIHENSMVKLLSICISRNRARSCPIESASTARAELEFRAKIT